MTDKPHSVMSGPLMRQPDGSVAGDIVDTFGFITRMTGVPIMGGWALSCVVIAPEGLKVFGLDDEVGT